MSIIRMYLSFFFYPPSSFRLILTLPELDQESKSDKRKTYYKCGKLLNSVLDEAYLT